MRVLMTGRHVKATSALKRYVEARLARLDRYGAKIGDMQVVLGVEKYRHTAEAVFTLNGAVVQSKASTNEMYASIDQLLDKIGRQIRKRKGKLIARQSRAAASRSARRLRESTVAPPDFKTVRTPLHTLTAGEAIEQLGGHPSAMVVFMNAVMNRIQVVRRLNDGGIELLDPQPE